MQDSARFEQEDLFSRIHRLVQSVRKIVQKNSDISSGGFVKSPRERFCRHASFCDAELSLFISNRAHESHSVFFYSVLTIPQAMQWAISLLLSHNEASMIFASSISELSTRAFISCSSLLSPSLSLSQQSSSALKLGLQPRIFSVGVTSLRLMRNHPPLIDRY